MQISPKIEENNIIRQIGIRPWIFCQTELVCHWHNTSENNIAVHCTLHCFCYGTVPRHYIVFNFQGEEFHFFLDTIWQSHLGCITGFISFVHCTLLVFLLILFSMLFLAALLMRKFLVRFQTTINSMFCILFFYIS